MKTRATLKEEFEGRADTRGWLFTLVTRDGDVAIYRRTRGEDETYEVVIVRRFKVDKLVKGRVICLKGDEYYPAASKWGSDGFSYMEIGNARAKFRELIEA